jgi:hypothetical protein
MREYTTTHDEKLLKEMNLGDHYICDAINEGLALCCVVSTDNFLLHDANIYKKSILISPVPETPEVLERLVWLGKQNIPTLMYGTKEKLSCIDDFEGLTKLDVENRTPHILEHLSDLGYHISFTKKDVNCKPPTMAIARHDNGLFFSVYNSNTTTNTNMKFPLGAPILCGMETEMTDGKSSYHFSRGEHRECRIFVEQNDGVISCREHPPLNVRYRRAIKISGLNDATVRLFPEKGCEAAVALTKTSEPDYDDRFTEVHDELYGTYLKGEHISGQIFFIIGHKGTR